MLYRVKDFCNKVRLSIFVREPANQTLPTVKEIIKSCFLNTDVQSKVSILSGIVNDTIPPGIYTIVVIQTTAYRENVPKLRVIAVLMSHVFFVSHYGITYNTLCDYSRHNTFCPD
ncbi:hypothetical protein FACS189442_6010 [Spirochaetia bacterium]|nr:hypothetical protein FACS189442_6010 [Spirochaetia bacterium]